jgi:hypothetical protein
MPEALRAHLEGMAGEHAGLLGVFLCQASRLPELITELIKVKPKEPLPLSLIIDTGLGGVPKAISIVESRSELLSLRMVEMPAPSDVDEVWLERVSEFVPEELRDDVRMAGFQMPEPLGLVTVEGIGRGRAEQVRPQGMRAVGVREDQRCRGQAEQPCAVPEVEQAWIGPHLGDRHRPLARHGSGERRQPAGDPQQATHRLPQVDRRVVGEFQQHGHFLVVEQGVIVAEQDARASADIDVVKLRHRAFP